MKGNLTDRRKFLKMCAGAVIGSLVTGAVVSDTFGSVPLTGVQEFQPGDIVVLGRQLSDLGKGLRGIVRRLKDSDTLVVQFPDNVHENPFSKSQPGFIPESAHRHLVDSEGNHQLIFVINECEFLFRPGDRVKLMENLSFQLQAGRQGIVSFIEDESSVGVQFDRDELVTVTENYKHLVLHCNRIASTDFKNVIRKRRYF